MAILRVHMKGKPLFGDVDIEAIARQTAGLTGADLANICNEAAICAGRRGAELLMQADFDHAMDRILAGLQQRRAMTEKEKRILAYHEAGHALVSHLMNDELAGAEGDDHRPRRRARLHAAHARRGALPPHQGGARSTGWSSRSPAVPPSRSSSDASRPAPRTTSRRSPRSPARWSSSTAWARPTCRARCAPTTTRSPRTPKRSATSSRRTSPTRAYAEALRILTKHRALLDRVAHALLEKETLSRKELLELFGDVEPESRADEIVGVVRVLGADASVRAACRPQPAAWSSDMSIASSGSSSS